MSTSNAIKVRRPVQEIPFLIRVIYFFLLGWELTGVWVLVAWLLNVTIIFLPLGLWMIDRVPQVLTLKMRPGSYVVDSKDGRSQFVPERQPLFLLRALYFIVIGWWFSLIWALFAWLLCATIIGLPIGVIMLNTLPFITTLHRS